MPDPLRTIEEEAELLRVSPRTLATLMALHKPPVLRAGRRRGDNQPVEIPRAVALACSAVSHGLGEWGPETKNAPARRLRR